MRAGQRAIRPDKEIARAELRRSEVMGRNEKARDLWHGLNAYVTERCGAITTLPYHWPCRLETLPESELPNKLRSLGWTVVDRGSESRLCPVAGFIRRLCYDVCLPSLK